MATVHYSQYGCGPRCHDVLTMPPVGPPSAHIAVQALIFMDGNFRDWQMNHENNEN